MCNLPPPPPSPSLLLSQIPFRGALKPAHTSKDRTRSLHAARDEVQACLTSVLCSTRIIFVWVVDKGQGSPRPWATQCVDHEAAAGANPATLILCDSPAPTSPIELYTFVALYMGHCSHLRRHVRHHAVGLAGGATLPHLFPLVRSQRASAWPRSVGPPIGISCGIVSLLPYSFTPRFRLCGARSSSTLDRDAMTPLSHPSCRPTHMSKLVPTTLVEYTPLKLISNGERSVFVG